MLYSPINLLSNNGDGYKGSSSEQKNTGVAYDAPDYISPLKRKRDDDNEIYGAIKKIKTLPTRSNITNKRQQETFEYLDNPYGYHQEPVKKINNDIITESIPLYLGDQQQESNWDIVPLPELLTFPYPTGNITNYPSSSETDNDIELMDLVPLLNPEEFDVTLFYHKLQQQWLDRMEEQHMQEDYAVFNRDIPGQLDNEQKQECLNAAHYRAEQIVKSVKDTWQLEKALRTELAVEHSPFAHLNKLDIVGLGTPSPRLVGQINPAFHIDLTALEMRGVKGPNTKVRWQSGTLTLDKAGNYTVGKKMQATYLSHDTLPGSESIADTEQKGWMVKLSGDNYIRGHLLNDNLGGPAVVHNLFPITDNANKKHTNNAEAYIKKGVEHGYLYEYSVDIQNVSETHLGSGLYSVDCDLIFDLGRMNTKGTISAHHKGKVESRCGQKRKVLFHDGNTFRRLDKNIEYGNDFTGGSPNQPVSMGHEITGTQGVLPTPDKQLVLGEFDDSFTFGGGTFFTPRLHDIFITGKEQKINEKAGKAKNLKLHDSSENDIVAYFESLIDNWDQDDIRNWVRAIQTLNFWEAIMIEAYESHGLKKEIAEDLFTTKEMGRLKVAIGTKVKNKPSTTRKNYRSDDSEDSEEYKHTNEKIIDDL